VITSVSPQADSRGHVFSVEITLDNPGNRIRPAMIGAVVVGDAPQGPARIVVPLAAIVRSHSNPEGFAVFRLEGRSGYMFALAHDVLVGSVYGNSIEVTRGLSAGDSMVSLGAPLLRDGQQVRAIE
jgi:multidrug efflux pump subunit AcrA (membrane-fusion protein)